MDAMREADIVRACRDKALIYPVMTEVALPGNIFILVIRNDIIRTCFDTGPAPGALVVVHDHNAVFPFYDSFFGTGLRTRRIITVPANINVKNEIHFAVDYPRAFF